MAPIQLEPKIRYDLIAATVGQVIAGACLTTLVGRSLWRSYRGLGPAQDTRERQAQRLRLIPVFTALALAGLVSAVYSSVNYAVLSYKVWASQRDIEIPRRFYGEHGVVPFGGNTTDIFLARWLSDTPLYLEAVEIVAEKTRRFWWGQQIELGLVSWSLLLAIEGRRRNMPLLWSYQLLGQLVSLSFAQNLFFIALLLTPTPLPQQDAGSLPVSRYIRIRDTIFPPKPSHWTPHPLLYFMVLLPCLAVIAMCSVMANTPALNQLVMSARALTLTPLLLPYVVPQSWGRVHTHPHQVYNEYSTMFQFISFGSAFLHAKATVVGVAYAAPDVYYHRHSIHLPFDTERRSSWERTTSGFGRILAAMADHPVVSGVGWDVLLSTLSIGLWAAIRSTDAWTILASSVPFVELPLHDELERTSQASKPKARRRSKASKASGDAEINETGETGSVRRRKHRKSKSEDLDADDSIYEPTASEIAGLVEGDTIPEAGNIGLESTALVWGLVTLGGLGVGSAGIFGGECVAR